ncbi:MAG: DUF2304 family protein [Candidatus Hydrogenedentes bacterium]|nr:DUF2304 family protein [Candidatus Hydrogenedentota bacterium]
MDGYTQTGIQTAHRLGILGLSVLLLAVVLELVRRGYLKERYALLWLATAGLSLLVGAFPSIITWLAHLFNFQYLTVLFAMYFAFTLALVLCFTIVISRLAERNRELTQEVALLAHKVEQIEKDPPP